MGFGNTLLKFPLLAAFGGAFARRWCVKWFKRRNIAAWSCDVPQRSAGLRKRVGWSKKIGAKNRTTLTALCKVKEGGTLGRE